jgi:hypothetical protein
MASAMMLLHLVKGGAFSGIGVPDVAAFQCVSSIAGICAAVLFCVAWVAVSVDGYVGLRRHLATDHGVEMSLWTAWRDAPLLRMPRLRTALLRATSAADARGIAVRYRLRECDEVLREGELPGLLFDMDAGALVVTFRGHGSCAALLDLEAIGCGACAVHDHIRTTDALVAACATPAAATPALPAPKPLLAPLDLGADTASWRVPYQTWRISYAYGPCGTFDAADFRDALADLDKMVAATPANYAAAADPAYAAHTSLVFRPRGRISAGQFADLLERSDISLPRPRSPPQARAD